MHELSLYAQVPLSKHHLILSVIAGLASMQPQPVVERRLQFIPKREPNTAPSPEIRKKALDTGIPKAFVDGTYRIQVVGDVSPRAASDDPLTGEKSDFDKYAFRCEFTDFPEVPGKRLVTSRIFETVNVLAGNADHVLTFMGAIGYKYAAVETLQSGARFTHGNIDIRLMQTHLLPQSPRPLEIVPKNPANYPILDRSGSYLMRATLLVQEDNKPEVMSGAFDEMLRLKDTLKGIVELDRGERLAMNPRTRPKVSN